MGTLRSDWTWGNELVRDMGVWASKAQSRAVLALMHVNLLWIALRISHGFLLCSAVTASMQQLS